MLLSGLVSSTYRSKKNKRTLVDTRLEMEVISQCKSGGHDKNKPSKTNIARGKIERKYYIFPGISQRPKIEKADWLSQIP